MQRSAQTDAKMRKLNCEGEAVRVSASYQWATVDKLVFLVARFRVFGEQICTICGKSQDAEGHQGLDDAQRQQKSDAHFVSFFVVISSFGIVGSKRVRFT
jgi:hypothetical protein